MSSIKCMPKYLCCCHKNIDISMYNNIYIYINITAINNFLCISAFSMANLLYRRGLTNSVWKHFSSFVCAVNIILFFFFSKAVLTAFRTVPDPIAFEKC